jgi:hypothetical protein
MARKFACLTRSASSSNREGEEHIAAPASHARHFMENRSGEDDRGSGPGLEGLRAVLGKRNLAALEIRVEIDRDRKPAMSNRDPGVVAMGPKCPPVSES